MKGQERSFQPWAINTRSLGSAATACRKSGTAPDYSYSDANKNSGITWGKDQFLEYITDPKAKIPGTKMIFPGVKNEKERNDLWAYISQFDKDGKKK